MIISETKLDDTFNDNLFVTNGYKLERKDRNAKGGGLWSSTNQTYLFEGLKTLNAK